MNTIAEMILRNAHLHADRLAVVNAGRRYTHAEHADRILRLARAIATLGARRGDRVAMLAHNSAELLEGFGAAACGGFIATPLNWRLSARELVRIALDCRPSVLLHDTTNADTARQIAEAVGDLRLVAIDGPPQSDPPGYEALLARAAGADRLVDLPSPDDTVCIIYTSGTTGTPKGVQWSHRALLQSAMAMASQAGERPTDRLVVVMPLFHVGANIEWLALQTMGGAAIVLPSFDPVTFFKTVEAERATLAHLAPVMVNLLVDHPDRTRHDLRSLRDIHYGSAPVPEANLRKAVAAFGPVFTQLYGMTEHLISTMLLPYQQVLDGDAKALRRLRSAGQPYPGVELRIFDASLRPVGTGEVGEVAVRSHATMSGYWGNPQATAEAVVDGWLLTGDMGSLDDDGYLYIVDRKKDMVISGGENIYCREVEEALLLHPAIADAAVIGVPDAKWGEAVKAFVILRDGLTLSEQDVIEHCRRNLASYKRPQSVAFVAEFPRLPHGKTDKKALRAPYWAGASRAVA